MPDQFANAPDTAESKSAGTTIDVPAALATNAAWLRTVVLARLGDATDAEEVMQQVALAAATDSHRVRNPAKIAPWLYRVAVTQALLHRRRLGRRRKLLGRYRKVTPQTEHDPSQPDPLDWLLAKEQQRLVRQALSSLPGRDAEILLLKHTQNWSYRQLAAHLGVSEAALEGRLHRARKKLRRTLSAADPTLAEASR